MFKYQRNNIIFRIASADAFGKFKAAQANAFLQLARRELNFDDAAKEIVLLEFDQFSNWLFRVERICLSAGEGFLPPTLRSAIYESFKDELKVVEGVMDGNRGIFTEEARSFTEVVHAYTMTMLGAEFGDATLVGTPAAYANIVNLVNNYLQHLLIAMHEFNNNTIRKGFPFVSVADFCFSGLDSSSHFSSCLERMKFFQKMGCGSVFILKNYTSHEIFDAANDFLAVEGFTLLKEEFELQSV